MRKWFWCCTAAAVVAAGLIGAATFCCPHPDSARSQGLLSVGIQASSATPFSGLPRAPLGTESGPLGRDGADAASDYQMESPATKLTPSIVIREDEDLDEPLAVGNEYDLAGCLTGPMEEWQANPSERPLTHRIMPYADEEVATPPAVSEGTAAAAQEQSDDGPSLWRRLVQALTGKTVTGDSEEAEPKEPAKDEDYLNRHYHDHDLICPYSGKSCSGMPYAPRPVPVPDPKSEPARGGSEESETIKPLKRTTGVNPMRFFNDPQELLQWRPAFPRIDTMEFRPSDHRLNEYSRTPGAL
jgi:hypothetical protein